MNSFRAEDARKILKLLYTDLLMVERVAVDEENNQMAREIIYFDLPCHLSIKMGLGARRGEMLDTDDKFATTNSTYALYLSPEYEIVPGDILTVQHLGKRIVGRAGNAVYSRLDVSVPFVVEEVA